MNKKMIYLLLLSLVGIVSLAGEWKPVGKPLELTFHAHDIKLLSWKGSLYLAFTQDLPTGPYPFVQRLTLLKWNRLKWVQVEKWNDLQVGSRICLAPWKEKFYVVIEKNDMSGTPYAGHCLEYLQLVQWDGQKWSKSGKPFIIGSKSTNLLSCLNIDHGIPYVGLLKPRGALSEGYDGSLIKYMDHSWKYVGAPYFFKHVQSGLSLAFLKGNPLLACNKGYLNHMPYVFKFNGRKWHSYPILKNDQDTSNALVKFHGQLYLFLYVVNGFDLDTTNEILLMKYQKKKWIRISSVAVPKNPNSGGVFSFIDSLGNIYIAFSDEQEKATVLRFNGVTWNYFGKPCFSTTAAWPLSFAEYKHKLYIAFADNRGEDTGQNNGKRIEVMEYETSVKFKGLKQNVRNMTLVENINNP
jgi:hypothetical protein